MIVGRRHTERSGRVVGTDRGDAFRQDGRAPCLVAFHGFTGTTSELRPMLDRVAARGYAVEAPLLPGHGSNPAELQDATFDVWISEMRAEVRAAQKRYGRVVVCGFSLGSLVAIELATSEAPDGLVLLGNAIRLSAPVRGALGFFDRRSWRLPDWYLLKLWSSDIRDPEQRRRIASYDRDPLRAALEVYRAGRKVEPKLSRIACPTLVIHGGKDRVCPASNLRLVGDVVRDVETKLYPQSAHLVAADVDRDAVAEDVACFIDRIAQVVPVEP